MCCHHAGFGEARVRLPRFARRCGRRESSDSSRSADLASAPLPKSVCRCAWGYIDAHGTEDGPSGMNTDLTDAGWVLMVDLFERQGGRGTPPRQARKHMVVRAGFAWRLLRKSFSVRRGVYRAFSRWAAVGSLEAIHDRLRQQWRDRIGRDPSRPRQSSTRRARAAPRKAA
jgi:hypothetical protein